MNVEHGGNTADLYAMSHRANLGHFDPHASNQTNFKEFVTKSKRDNANDKQYNIIKDHHDK